MLVCPSRSILSCCLPLVLLHSQVIYSSCIAVRGHLNSMSTKNKRSLDAFVTTSSKSASPRKVSRVEASTAQNTATATTGRFQIYCDLDGVLVDFDAGLRKLFPGTQDLNSIPSGRMWAAISKAESFYKNLPWTKDGKELWENIHTLSPDILTGVPTYKKSREEKFAWCKKELQRVDTIRHVDMAGPKSSHQLVTGTRIMRQNLDDNHAAIDGRNVAVNVITCWSKLKHMESRPGAVLIDDREELRQNWEAQGGTFIHHTSTANTLAVLRQMNIIQ